LCREEPREIEENKPPTRREDEVSAARAPGIKKRREYNNNKEKKGRRGDNWRAKQTAAGAFVFYLCRLILKTTLLAAQSTSSDYGGHVLLCAFNFIPTLFESAPPMNKM